MKWASKGEIGALRMLQGLKGIPRIGWASGDFTDSIPWGRIDDDTIEVLVTHWCGSYLHGNEVLCRRSVLPMVCNLLEVVLSVHHVGFVHGDIKPQNVCFDLSTREITLIDFGHSCRAHADREVTEWLGTEGWRAPEVQLLREGSPGLTANGFLADTWSIGKLVQWIISHAARIESRERVSLSLVARALSAEKPEERLSITKAVHMLSSPDTLVGRKMGFPQRDPDGCDTRALLYYFPL
ncbi:hypothetical protein PM082_016006 [Marasmius tenuissimus]|nr:hypothetical protein PM082_016006 [Marasmius tenuissimus]